MTVDAAARIAKTTLFAADAETCEADLSQVERLDAAGCQVLLWARRDAERRGATWRISGCSEPAAAAIRLLGCGRALGLDQLVPDIEMQKQELP